MPPKRKRTPVRHRSKVIETTLVNPYSQFQIHTTYISEPTLAELQNHEAVSGEDLVSFIRLPLLGWKLYRNEHYRPVVPSAPGGLKTEPRPVRIPSPQVHKGPEAHHCLLDLESERVLHDTQWQDVGEWEQQVVDRISLMWKHYRHRHYAIAVEQREVAEIGVQGLVGLEEKLPVTENID